MRPERPTKPTIEGIDMNNTYLSPLVLTALVAACQTGQHGGEVSQANRDSFTVAASYVNQDFYECFNTFSESAWGSRDYCIIVTAGPHEGQISVLAYAVVDNDLANRVGLIAQYAELPIVLNYVESGRQLSVTCIPDSSCTARRGAAPDAFGTIHLIGTNVVAARRNGDACDIMVGESQFGQEFEEVTGAYVAPSNTPRVLQPGEDTAIAGIGTVQCAEGQVSFS